MKNVCFLLGKFYNVRQHSIDNRDQKKCESMFWWDGLHETRGNEELAFSFDELIDRHHEGPSWSRSWFVFCSFGIPGKVILFFFDFIHGFYILFVFYTIVNSLWIIFFFLNIFLEKKNRIFISFRILNF